MSSSQVHLRQGARNWIASKKRGDFEGVLVQGLEWRVGLQWLGGDGAIEGSAYWRSEIIIDSSFERVDDFSYFDAD